MTQPSTLYNVVFLQGPGVRARAWINDLPVHLARPVPTNDGSSQLGNHLLWPGENTLRVEVQQMGKPETSFYHADVLRLDDPKAEPQRIASIAWPQAWMSWPEKAQVLPFNQVTTFVMPDDHPPPLVAGARPEEVPLEGTPEMHAAVHEVHRALADRDGAGLIDAVGLRMQDQARFYGDLPDTRKESYVPRYAEAFRDPWEVPPFEPKRLVFERCAGGRAVFVTGADGQPAVFGQNAANPDQSYATDLLLIRQDGTWRVFR